MGYGVIGNTKVSGSFVLGSSPGIPANLLTEVAAPSYSGLVLRPLTAATPVQIRLGSPLGKSLVSSEARLFCLCLRLSENLLGSMVPPRTPRKATSVSRSHHFCGFSKHKWLLGGKEKRGAQNLTFTPSLGIVLSVSVIGAVVARFVHTEEVTGSNPVSRTKEPPFQGTGVLLCPPGQTHRQQSTAADTTTRE